MTSIEKLAALCNLSFTINYNCHKDENKRIEQYVSGLDPKEDINTYILDGMIQKDTIVSIQCYPDNCVGFYRVYHFDINLAIDEMIKIIEEDRKA